MNDIADHRRFADLVPFLRHVRRQGFLPGTVVDVGAHAGSWTELVLQVFPEANVLMIEPQREMRAPLDALCTRHERVRWVEAAAGADDGVGLLTIWPDHQGTSLLPTREPARVADGSQRDIAIRRLDDLIEESGFVDVDFVKLDVQGYELEVLRGAPKLFGTAELFLLETSLYRFLPGIPILREVIEFMAERGYEVYDVPGYIWRPIDGALGQLDVAFARGDGALRRHALW